MSNFCATILNEPDMSTGDAAVAARTAILAPGQSGDGKTSEGKHFFFEKKKQKTFMSSLLLPKRQGENGSHPHNQKFFGSFFQKRTASFLNPLQPVVLIVSTTWWAFPARIAMECAARGLAVDVICGRGHPLLKTAAVRRHFAYGAARPLRSLAHAIEASGASLVVPCDDRALAHLHGLHANVPASDIAWTIERSLGDPAGFAIAKDRAGLIACARGLGIAAPETLRVENAAALDAALDRLGLPAVLKLDGSWGGLGVAVARTREQAHRSFARFARPVSLGRAAKRLLVDRDPFHLLPWARREAPGISVQAYVPGRPANSISAACEGRILGTICAEAVAVQRPFGASSVVRVIDHAAMAQAAEKLAAHLNLSGVFGLDFLIDDTTGEARLVEMNARATPLCHLALGPGRDLIGALCQLAGLPPIAEAPSITDRDVIAYFPQAWHTTPDSPWLQRGHHDVPWNEPALLQELLKKPWPDRGLLATLWRMAQRRGAAGGVPAINRTMDVT